MDSQSPVRPTLAERCNLINKLLCELREPDANEAAAELQAAARKGRLDRCIELPDEPACSSSFGQDFLLVASRLLPAACCLLLLACCLLLLAGSAVRPAGCHLGSKGRCLGPNEMTCLLIPTNSKPLASADCADQSPISFRPIKWMQFESIERPL